MPQLNSDAIKNMGFASVGENVFISDLASFYNCSNISIGSNVRIDDYCVLSAGAGGIEIGSYVHIAAASTLIGSGRISMKDFSGLSSRVSIYSSSDDYSGSFMTNPMVPSIYRNVTNADVCIGRHVIVGCGSVILPGVHVGDGAAIGALSLVWKDCEEFGVYQGNPARRISERKRDLLELEKAFLQSHNYGYAS
jgi:acetyltransferase-like isoleucine patch superfamily enzyme